MRKRVNLINRVSALGLPFFLALGLITPAFSITANAEAAQVLESSATVADCVMTYYAMSGNAVANTQWINTLYDSLGSSFGTIGDFAENSLMTYVDGVWQPTETLVQNIENTSAYTNLGLDNVFNVSAQEVANGGGYAVATGASTLGGAVSCVATHGILPVLGGVTAAYWGGIGIGTLANHLIDKYKENIAKGVAIDAQQSVLDMIPAGGRYAEIQNGSITYMYAIPNGVNTYYSLEQTGDGETIKRGFGINLSDSRVYVNYKLSVSASTYNFTLNGKTSNGNYASFLTTNTTRVYKGFSAMPSAYNDYSEFATAIRNGSIEVERQKSYSPDCIGEKGNLEGDYSSESGYTVPDLKPQIDPQTQSGKPLSLQDWLQFANGVQNNNNSTSPVPNNTSLFQDILDAIRGLIPTPGPTPDPNPGGETYPVPGPVPDPSPVPDPEYQPETKPQPQYTEKPTENETDITEGDPWTTPDLLDKFPFCIPRDVYRVFTKLDSGARAAPHIQWRFNPNSKIDYTFDIDFAEWDSVATLLRTLELLGFIVALALATRKMILS